MDFDIRACGLYRAVFTKQVNRKASDKLPSI